MHASPSIRIRSHKLPPSSSLSVESLDALLDEVRDMIQLGDTESAQFMLDHAKAQQQQGIRCVLLQTKIYYKRNKHSVLIGYAGPHVHVYTSGKAEGKASERMLLELVYLVGMAWYVVIVSWWSLIVVVGISLEMKNYAVGLEVFQKFTKFETFSNSKLDAQAMLVFGKLYLNCGLLKNAKEWISKSLELNPLLWAAQKILNELNVDAIPKTSSYKQEIPKKDLITKRIQCHQLLCKYECDKALALLSSMPNQYVDNSHWCLVIKARCYFEKAQYKQAIDAFKKARALNSFLNFGLDWYSSALWQMKLESDLSYLSQELKKLDTFCPETWVVLGNTFSLQREHESALNYFSKSTEIDSSYAYGYTLAAHELIVTENYEKAIQLCRRALKENPRHYIAWYRLGSILSRQEKFDMALFHFKKAIDINPNNSVLFCSLAMAHHAKGDKVEAFNHYNKSCSLDPTNLVVKFQLAKLHSEIEEYEHALSLFKEILQVAPREAVVHYEIGLIFKRFNSMDKALQHLSISMDLDPKDRNLIKSAMDSLTQ